jgi:hypothetical protein
MENEEQRARDRSEVLAYQYPDAMDPLKLAIRKQIGQDLDARRAAFAACGQMQDGLS